MLSPVAQRVLIGWEPLGPRIIIAAFRTRKKIKLNVIQCYAPTNDSDEEEKQEFYDRLQSAVDKCVERDITIVMGDFNAKIGEDNTGYEEAMGRHGLGELSENGERFIDFCALNRLVIGGRIFPHRRIHKATWVSPDHTTENQIDHICISKKFRRSLQDVRVRRGADVASDHHLLTLRIKLKLKKSCTETTRRQRYNVGLLRETGVREEFKLMLSNRFQVLQELVNEEEVATTESSSGRQLERR